MKSESGVILIMVLWVMVILSMLALSLSRRGRIALALTNHHVRKAHARAIALAGLFYARGQLEKDAADPDSGQSDTLYACGVHLEQGRTSRELFDQVPFSDGNFSVYYPAPGGGEAAAGQWGCADEERRVNLNGLNAANYQILSYLLEDLGVEAESARTVAASVVDWIDRDDDVFQETYGAENNYYTQEGYLYPCKNAALDSVEELPLVKGMTPEIYERIKGYVTVYPKTGGFQLNLQTVPAEVLRPVLKSFTGSRTNTEPEDAASLAEKILACRKGEDGLDATEDDRIVESDALNLNTEERVLYLMLAQYQTRVSNIFRCRVQGRITGPGPAVTLEAVIDRQDRSVLSWRRF